MKILGIETSCDETAVAIVGIGETAYTKASGRTAREIGAEAAERALAELERFGLLGAASVEQSTRPTEAVAGAHAVHTDTWVSMGQEDDKQHRIQQFEGYTVDEDLMATAGEQAWFLHCLPAHRGDEVTDEVMDGPQSVVFDEAENRLHAQKGILAWCLHAGAR